MAVIIGVITDTCKTQWAKMHGDLIPFSKISFFRMGEGGWQNPGPVPRIPDPTFTDLDALLDPSRALINQRYAADERFAYQKSFVGGDIVEISPGVLRCRCFLDFGEANNDGFGNSPEFWEIGVYTATGKLLTYATFPLQLKDATKSIENFVDILWGA